MSLNNSTSKYEVAFPGRLGTRCSEANARFFLYTAQKMLDPFRVLPAASGVLRNYVEKCVRMCLFLRFCPKHIPMKMTSGCFFFLFLVVLWYLPLTHTSWRQFQMSCCVSSSYSIFTWQRHLSRILRFIWFESMGHRTEPCVLSCLPTRRNWTISCVFVLFLWFMSCSVGQRPDADDVLGFYFRRARYHINRGRLPRQSMVEALQGTVRVRIW